MSAQTRRRRFGRRAKKELAERAADDHVHTRERSLRCANAQRAISVDSAHDFAARGGRETDRGELGAGEREGGVTSEKLTWERWCTIMTST